MEGWKARGEDVWGMMKHEVGDRAGEGLNCKLENSHDWKRAIELAYLMNISKMCLKSIEN